MRVVERQTDILITILCALSGASYNREQAVGKVVETVGDLWYDNVGHGFGERVKILRLVEPQDLYVVLQVVLDAVVDVRYLADVVDVGVRPEVFDEFAPASLHQLPRLTVVQLYL